MGKAKTILVLYDLSVLFLSVLLKLEVKYCKEESPILLPFYLSFVIIFVNNSVYKYVLFPFNLSWKKTTIDIIFTLPSDIENTIQYMGSWWNIDYHCDRKVKLNCTWKYGWSKRQIIIGINISNLSPNINNNGLNSYTN